MARPLLDMMEANYSLDCATCEQAEEEQARREDRDVDPTVGQLSDGGCNLTRRQAASRAAAHLRRFPGHYLSWTAMGAARSVR